MSNKAGALYVVATPIGNLEDISQRALSVLQEVDVVLVEDSRRSERLLARYGIQTPKLVLQEHNERRVVPGLASRMAAGERMALICDAGTPLVSDPGFVLVRSLAERRIPVIAVPGPSALLCALCVSALPTDRFVFEGFLPAAGGARRARLKLLVGEPRTLVFYEAPHRIERCLADMSAVFGSTRRAVVARELTKVFESVERGSLQELCVWVCERDENRKGEMVVVVEGCAESSGEKTQEQARRTLTVLMEEGLALKQAVSLAARLTGEKRNRLYRDALDLEQILRRKATEPE